MSITLHEFEPHTDRQCASVLHEDWRETPACHFVYTGVPDQPFCGSPERDHRYWRRTMPAQGEG